MGTSASFERNMNQTYYNKIEYFSNEIDLEMNIRTYEAMG